MRKWIIVLGIIIIAVAVFLNVKPISIHPINDSIAVNQKAFSRTILLEQMWEKWWPGTSNDKSTFTYKGMNYFLKDKKITSLIINIYDATDTIHTELVFVPSNKDSIILTWSFQQLPSTIGLSNITLARKINNLEQQMKDILSAMKNYYSNEQNIYSLQINKSLVQDSVLISTAKVFDSFPNNSQIYSLIEKLKNYAKLKDAVQTNPPMLNINTTDSVHYRIQVALPVNKKLPDEKDIVYRWMLGRGNILISEVIGGYGIINNGFAAIELYVKDHNRVAPAIPFQQLITDRKNEPDTSKWKTLLCWPVM